MKTRHLIFLSTLNISLALGLLLFAAAKWQHEPPSLEERPVRQWNPTDSFLTTQPDSDQPRLTFDQALTRPLFQKDRRPFVPQITPVEPPPAPEPVAEAPPPPPRPDAAQLLLKGLLLTPDRGKALIATLDAPDGVWVETGAVISGWTVKSLTPQGALLASGETEALLKLYVDKPAN